jgi:hypothetical protein
MREDIQTIQDCRAQKSGALTMAYSMKGIKMSADAKTMIKAMNMTSHKT